MRKAVQKNGVENTGYRALKERSDKPLAPPAPKQATASGGSNLTVKQLLILACHSSLPIWASA